MKPPYTQVFRLVKPITVLGKEETTTTSVVVDHEEFEKLCDTLRDMVATGTATNGLTNKMVDDIRTAQYLPLIARGTKTAALFSRYGVTTNIMSVITRGTGTQLLERIISGD